MADQLEILKKLQAIDGELFQGRRQQYERPEQRRGTLVLSLSNPSTPARDSILSAVEGRAERVEPRRLPREARVADRSEPQASGGADPFPAHF